MRPDALMTLRASDGSSSTMAVETKRSLPSREVEAVDYEALLRRWTEYYDLLKSNKAKTFIALAGATASVSRLVSLGLAERFAVTGSFAAVRLAPIAAPALLTIYTYDADSITSGVRPRHPGRRPELCRTLAGCCGLPRRKRPHARGRRSSLGLDETE